MKFPQFLPGQHYLTSNRKAAYAIHVLSPFQVAVARFVLVDTLGNPFSRGTTPIQQVYAREFENAPWGLNDMGLSWYHLTNAQDINSLGFLGEHMRYEEYGGLVARARIVPVINFLHGVDGSADL